MSVIERKSRKYIKIELCKEGVSKNTQQRQQTKIIYFIYEYNYIF